jgi:hypothetical protein
VQLALVVTMAALLYSGPLTAQSPEPFSRLTVSAAAATNVNRVLLHRYWRSDTGWLMRVATPFYLGSTAVVVQTVPFTPRGPDQLDVDALTVLAEWNGERVLLPGVRGIGGIHLGQTTFKFRTQRERTFIIEESELLSGVQIGVRTRLAGDVGLAVMANHQKIFTQIPIHLTFVACGLEYSLATPSWLRTFLE